MQPDPTGQGAAEDVARAEQDAHAVELRASGLSFRQIARELGISPSTAYASVERALVAVRRPPTEALIELEAQHLDDLRREAIAVLRAEHPLTSGTDLVRGEDGRVLADAGPVLAAIRALLAVSERRAKLLGLDRPTRLEHEVTTIDLIDQEIEELLAEQARRVELRRPAEPDPEALAAAVTAALDAAGVPQAAREAAYAAVEAQLRARGNGGPW